MARPRPEPPGAPLRLLATLPRVSEALGVGLRALQRYQTEGVIAPAEPRRGSRPSRWDVVAVARALLASRATLTPRDRRELAQAAWLEHRLRRDRKDVLDRAVVVRRGVAVAKTVTAYLVTLPGRMVKDGIITPEHEAIADDYIRERLDELSRLGDEGYLCGDHDGDGDAGT